MLSFIKRLIPLAIFKRVQPNYHRMLATLAAIRFGFPGRKISVIAVTGTKGKSTVTELINAILEEAGCITALSNTIRFKIADESQPNLYKMSMPGRFFIQRFLRDAVTAGCQYAVIEMTSEGAKLYRHLYTYLDALVFTNIAPEHIEAHGSFEAYLAAKLRIRDALAASPKKEKIAVSNKDDEQGALFLEVPGATTAAYSLKHAEPYALTDRGVLLTFEGVSIHAPLLGKFNIYNILAAITLARTLGISIETIKRAIEKTSLIKGRVEKIDEGQKYTVVVDYAHTPDSLTALYGAFAGKHTICVLGNTGGGRDKWKRPEMAAIADTNCTRIILTNEDPYDEDPQSILNEMVPGFKVHTPEIILDRREAIRRALILAHDDSVVLITGKGTDPYIMGPKGTKTPWSDAEVAREELQSLLGKQPKERDAGGNGNVE